MKIPACYINSRPGFLLSTLQTEAHIIFSKLTYEHPPLGRRGFFYIQIILELVARLSYNVHEEKFVERLRMTAINRQLAERLKNEKRKTKNNVRRTAK